MSPFFDKYEDYAIRYSNALIIESISECKAVRARGVKNIYNRVVRIPAGVDTESFKPENANPEVKYKYGASEKDRFQSFKSNKARDERQHR